MRDERGYYDRGKQDVDMKVWRALASIVLPWLISFSIYLALR